MPRDVLVQRGLQSPQPQPLAPKSPGGLNVGPVVDDSGGKITFESKIKDYSIQLNTPRERFDMLTGQKVKDQNLRIKFKHGLYEAKTPEEAKAIVASKYFGEPHNALVWRRTERQKLEVRNAVRDLGAQLQTRPDLLKEVVALIKNIPGASGLFELPIREDEKEVETETVELTGL